MSAAPDLVPGRDCDGCAMCCKLFDVPPIGKAAGAWCHNLDGALMCTIYEDRPHECRAFFCHYRRDADVPEHWKPHKSHMVILAEASGVRITAHVDPAQPLAWRKQPYYQDLKAWSANRLTAGKQVHVRIGTRTVVILPDRDVDLGTVGDRAILTRPIQTAQGQSLAIELVDKNDPRVRPQTPFVFRR